ncbi:uncharacterized protein LOC105767672 isoform X1 [Gossypium raimondii]|uniref:uncharacterized protein LOC105767672 isoform X1 n=1 Tax=Gossypium raimondii TaxID=29730 RepID=UPI00227D1517|nr:uncharacterized protein LOC105767672 isoform X1 [Gossypium raimondii]
MMMKGAALAADIKRNLGVIKERVLEKLAAAAVPADALENARHFLESVVRDVTVAAQGLTKDALHRIKTHLVDILPSLSPAITRKQLVDDAEKEANEEHESEGEQQEGEEARQDEHQLSGKSTFVSPASSLFALIKPLSRL